MSAGPPQPASVPPSAPAARYSPSGPSELGPGELSSSGTGGGRRGLIIGLAVVLVAVLGGGVAFGINWLRGSGPQPADVLPADAVAYVRVDLQPSGSQQMSAYRFLTKFPTVADQLGEENDPLVKQLFDVIKKADPSVDIDYEADIEPWLGDGAGIAVLPGADDVEVVGAVQVTDEEAARAGFAKLSEQSGDELGVAFADNFAILHEDQARAEAYAQSDDTLAADETFSADMDTLGEEGIFSFWLDSAELVRYAARTESSAMPGADIERAADQAGRMVGAVRFDDRYLEFAGNVVGAETPVEPVDGGPTRLADLPATTVAAIGVSGGGDGVLQGWSEMLDQLDEAARSELQAMMDMAGQYDLTLPDDLATLLGDNITVALDERGVDSLAEALAGLDAPAGSDPFQAAPPEPRQLNGLGVRIDTDDVAAVEQVVDKVLTVLGGGAPLELPTARSDGALAVSMDQAYADTLLGDGALGDEEIFQLAVADPDEAQVAMFVDLDRLEHLYVDGLGGEGRADLEAVQAIGLSATTTADGGSFTLRLVPGR